MGVKQGVPSHWPEELRSAAGNCTWLGPRSALSPRRPQVTKRTSSECVIEHPANAHVPYFDSNMSVHCIDIWRGGLPVQAR